MEASRFISGSVQSRRCRLRSQQSSRRARRTVAIQLPVALALVLAAAAPARADQEAPPAAADDHQPSEAERVLKSIEWTRGPAKAGIGNHAEIQVPAGYAYTGSTGAQKLLELMHNPTDGSELGILTDENMDIFIL